MRRLGLALCLLLLSLWAAPVDAAEQRCTELGVNCVCHRSMAAPSGWAPSPIFADFFYEVGQPADSKLCGWGYGGGNLALMWHAASGQLTSIVGLNGVLATRDTMQGGTSQVFPTDAQKAQLTGHVAVRYYLRLGSGYLSTDNLTCGNDKYTQLGDYLTAYTHQFQFGSNGAGFSPTVTPSMMIGKWWMVEHHLNNYNSPTTHTVYLRNVTDNGAEIVGTFPAGVNSTDHATLVANTQVIHRYREGSSCPGSFDLQMAMLAHWPTNAGQRIGASYELEGGGGGGTPPTPPNAPTNFSVTELLRQAANWLVAVVDQLLGVGEAAAETLSAEQVTIAWPPKVGERYTLLLSSFAWTGDTTLGPLDAGLGQIVYALPVGIPAGQPGDDRWICVREQSNKVGQGCNDLKLGTPISLPPSPTPAPAPNPTVEERLASLERMTQIQSASLSAHGEALIGLVERTNVLQDAEEVAGAQLAAIKHAVCALTTKSTLRDALRKALGGC